MARPKQISDSELLAAARKVFLKHGANVSVATIAKTLGVTAAALFHRVGSKNQLLVKALEPPEPPAISILKGGFQAGTPADVQMVDVLTGMANYLDTAIASEFCMRAGGVTKVRQNLYVDYPIRLRQVMAKWLKEAQDKGSVRAGDTKIMAEALLGTLEMRFTLANLMHKKHSRASDQAFVEGLVREILHRDNVAR